MPRQQIAVVGDADSDAKKQSLFEQVRSGAVRVLIGSTQKMGVGTNVQRRLVALHHLDAPWKPAEVEQREGRILRQGNENSQVAIYRYVTEGSFDAYMWQALETKAHFIAQVMGGRSALRRSEDIGGQELSYAEVKAIASGNPAVLTLAEADAELQRLALLHKNHADEQFLARRKLRELPSTIERLKRRVQGLQVDQATMAAQVGSPLTLGGRRLPHDEALIALGRSLDALPQFVLQSERVPMGSYRGLEFGMFLSAHSAPEVYLQGEVMRHSSLSKDHHGPRAVLNALERLYAGYGPEIDRVNQDIDLAEGQHRDYEDRLGKPYTLEGYQRELTRLRDQLKDGLARPANAEGNSSEPTVAALAKQIKTLRSAHAVEPGARAFSERLSLAAEEPVTTRLKRKIDAAATTRPCRERPEVESSAPAPPEPTEDPQAIALNEPLRTAGYQELVRAARGRARQQCLF